MGWLFAPGLGMQEGERRGGNLPVGWPVLFAHTLGVLVTAGLVALLVYEKLGLRSLRSVWLNLDAVRGMVLVATGLLAPVIS